MKFDGMKAGYRFHVSHNPSILRFRKGDPEPRIMPGTLYVWYGPDIWPDDQSPCIDFMEEVRPEHEGIVEFLVECANKRLSEGS